jgi:hypothetical protein
MEQTLQDRIRERAHHLWSNDCGQGDDNHYWLKERAVGTADGSWLLALERAGGIAKDQDRRLLHRAG